MVLSHDSASASDFKIIFDAENNAVIVRRLKEPEPKALSLLARQGSWLAARVKIAKHLGRGLALSQTLD
jgi:hypothetical protein